MGKIIALQGKGNSGKSTTITILRSLLLANGYSSVPSCYKFRGKDFSDILINGNKKIGVTSSGDNYKTVHARLSYFVNSGCDICICACRTHDRKPPGSVAAVNSFPGHKPQFVKKTVKASAALQLQANTSDANTLLSRI